MERSRNIDFNSDVEMDSLKDVVWRLTTRVYLLEDFIAEKFGEVLGPSGFEKASSEISSPSMPNSHSLSKLSTIDESPNVSVSDRVRRCRKRRKQSFNSGVKESSHNEVQKIPRTTTLEAEKDPLEVTTLSDQPQSSGNDENELMIMPKTEVEGLDSGQSDGDYEFLNEETECTNDSTEKDPDFNPFLGSSQPPNNGSNVTEWPEQNQLSANNRPFKITPDPEYCIDTKKTKWSTYFNYIGHTGKLNMLWQCNQCLSKISVSTTSKSNAKRHYFVAHKIDIRNITQKIAK